MVATVTRIKTARAAAPDQDVRDYLYNASDNIIDCRDIGHDWRRTHKRFLTEGSGTDAVFRRELQCSRCLTIKWNRFHRLTLELLGSGYQYAEGYQAKGTVTGVDRQSIRWYLAYGEEVEAAARTTTAADKPQSTTSPNKKKGSRRGNTRIAR